MLIGLNNHKLQDFKACRYITLQNNEIQAIIAKEYTLYIQRISVRSIRAKRVSPDSEKFEPLALMCGRRNISSVEEIQGKVIKRENIMGLDNAIYALSNANALMGSALGYVDAKNRGANTGDALMGFGFNVMNGAIRNEAAKDIRDRSGSYLGYAVNSAAGYGTPEANYRGTMGLIGASMLTSPFGIFGCGYSPYMMPSMIYGGGMGMWGGSFFGGGCGCNNAFMFGGPTLFGPRGFWC